MLYEAKTGYLLNVKILTRKNTRDKVALFKFVKKILEGYEEKGYHVFFAPVFSS